MKRVTFITTGQLTTNPRLVKEADALSREGYDVKVICCFYNSWAVEFDRKLTASYPDRYIFSGGDPVQQPMLYYKTRLRQKICVALTKWFKGFGIPENAISRAHAEALSMAKKIKTDLYIAHNLGALPAAAAAAKYSRAKVGYDAEDMHSAQFTSHDDEAYRLNKYIEEKYFPQTDYFTAASPLIASNYKKIYPALAPVVLNNLFPKVGFPFRGRTASTDPLKLFWFSQTIGPERGIEEIIVALAEVDQSVQLHLLGNCAATYKSTILELSRQKGVNTDNICFHAPVSPDSLFSFATQFDVGMATETGVPFNRNICLTNKIFTYIQCGLALIASDTQAQASFIRQHPNAGKLYQKNSPKSLANCINAYVSDRDVLYQVRLANYQSGQATLNWETESLVFTGLVESTLEKP